MQQIKVQIVGPKASQARGTGLPDSRCCANAFNASNVPLMLLRFFTDFAVKKWPHAGQFEPAGMVAVRCLDDGSAEHSLPRPTERQLRLRRSHRPERLFPDGA